MSEPSDRELEEQADILLDGQIADYEEERRTSSAHESALAGLTEHANALRDAPIPEEDWALVANHLRSIEIMLAEKRREVEEQASEVARAARKLHPSSREVRYESPRGNLVEQKKRVRSYNTSGLLAKLVDAGDLTLVEAIQEYESMNALTIGWKVTGVENTADRYGFDVPTARHEITDGDAEYLVGVVTTVKMVRG